jgi:hypothetical protein
LNHVSQLPYSNCCQQACIAMLAGVTLAEVIALVGDARMGSMESKKCEEKFGIKFGRGFFTEAYGYHTVGGLSKNNRALWCGVWDSLDPGFAHNVLIVDRALYDPYVGINPAWPWSRYISQVTIVEAAPMMGDMTPNAELRGAPPDGGAST